MNRQPLPVLHGGPVRLVVPNWYAHNWIKWVKKITFMDQEDSGFFMKKGYRMPKTPVKPGEKWDSSTGNPITTLKVQSIILHPRAEEKVGLGAVKVSGKTFSGSGVITKLEISIDGGKHWQLAKLESPHAEGGWQQFEAEVQAKKVGKMIVMSRATDSANQTQPMTQTWNPSGYLWNAVDKVAFEVVKKVPSFDAGKSLAQEKCLTCHTQEMFDSQQLNQAGWEKVLGKMEAFGVKLTTEEKMDLVQYFSQRPFKSPKMESVDYAIETAKHETSRSGKGSLSKGKELFGIHCASCHGEMAEGKIGPTLLGRQVPEDYFYRVLQNGMRAMPSFQDSLSQADMVNLREFLLQ
jgi:mono/diheme cytochrome c family protein